MTDKIIVLRAIKTSESDLIIHGLNPEGARMNFIAKGALRSRKRFGGGILEPTHYISVLYKPGRGSSDESPLHFLQEAQLLDGFNGLRQDYSRLEAALAIVQMVSQVAQDGVVDSGELFDLLGNALRAAEKSDHLDILQLQFEAKLLYLQGVLHGSTIPTELVRKTLKDHSQIELSADERRVARGELKRSWEMLGL